jgi:hypothetical protein
VTDFRYMDRVRARERDAPPHPAALSAPGPAIERDVVPAPHASSASSRLLGGSPLGVFLRLVFLSFLVGAALAWLDIRPQELLWWAEGLARRVWSLGFEGLREGVGYVAVGAMIVVPLWLVSRLFGGARG